MFRSSVKTAKLFTHYTMTWPRHILTISASFSVRQHICRACHMLSTVRPCMCPSICNTGGSVKNSWSWVYAQ